jgi:hypothetical protein
VATLRVLSHKSCPFARQHQPRPSPLISLLPPAVLYLLTQYSTCTLMSVTGLVRPLNSSQHNITVGRPPGGDAKRSPAARLCSSSPSVGFYPDTTRGWRGSLQRRLSTVCTYMFSSRGGRLLVITLVSSSRRLSAFVLFATAYGSPFPSRLDCLHYYISIDISFTYD